MKSAGVDAKLLYPEIVSVSIAGRLHPSHTCSSGREMRCHRLVADQRVQGPRTRSWGRAIVGTELLPWTVKWPDLPCDRPLLFMPGPTLRRARWGMSDRGAASPRSFSRNDRHQLFSAAFGFASRTKKSRRRPSFTCVPALTSAVRSSPVLSTAIEAREGRGPKQGQEHHDGYHWRFHFV